MFIFNQLIIDSFCYRILVMKVFFWSFLLFFLFALAASQSRYREDIEDNEFAEFEDFEEDDVDGGAKVPIDKDSSESIHSSKSKPHDENIADEDVIVEVRILF